MAFVEMNKIRPFRKIEEEDIYSDSDNKFLQLLAIQYYRFEEALRFNEKYQPIGKGTNNIAETLANSDKTKKVFEFVKGALTVGVLGYAVINNVGITETLGNLASIIPGFGEGLSNIITSSGSNGIITQMLADSSFSSAITKGIEQLTEKKDIIKDFVIDKLPTKIKEKYYEIEDKKAEKRMQLENEYETDKETYENNKKLYKRKTKEILKDIFSRDKEKDKITDNTRQIVNNSNEQKEQVEKDNPWQLTQEQRLETKRKIARSQNRENTKVIKNQENEQEDQQF